MKSKRITVVAAGLAALGLVGVAASTGVASVSKQAPSGQVAANGAVKAQTVFRCDGARNLSLATRTNAVPFSFAGTGNAKINVPGAVVGINGPAVGTDTLLVTYSAETYYTGTGWMGIEVHKNGVPIQPFANNGSPYAINSSATYQGNSAQFCTKIGPGFHRIQVKAYTTGGAGEFGWLDDWTLSVLRFN